MNKTVDLLAQNESRYAVKSCLKWPISRATLSIEDFEFATTDHGTLPVRMILFDSQLFDITAFSANKILLPPIVAASVSKRQAEYFFGRAAARLGLESLGITADIPTGLSREPIWPDGIIGSITHCKNTAAAIVQKRGPLSGLGIDIEDTDISKDAEVALLNIAVTSDELCLFSDTGLKMSRSTFLTLAFSAKESFLKGAFPDVKRLFDFSAVRVVEYDLEQRQIHIEVLETLSNIFVRGRTFSISFCLIKNKIMTCFAY